MRIATDDFVRRDEVRLESTVRRLEQQSGKPIRDLQYLAEAWGRTQPCRAGFGGELPRRAPTVRAIAAVIGWLPHSNPHVERAALIALSKIEYAIGGDYAPRIASFLTRDDPILRILAARVLRYIVSPDQREAVMAAARDEVYTVRWYAAACLVSLGSHEEAIQVLGASLPRRPHRSATDDEFDPSFCDWREVAGQLVQATNVNASDVLHRLRVALEKADAMTPRRLQDLERLARQC